MNSPVSSDFESSAGDHRFRTTHWSLVLAAGGAESVPAREALATLCEAYWYPLYAYVRRRGFRSHDAQDLTQAFFAALLEKNTLASAIPERGRFRSFLLGCLKHFLDNEWQKSRAAKRGGGQVPISLDDEAESRYRREPADVEDAESLFERRWALTILDRVMEGLKKEMAEAGKSELFEALKDRLAAGGSADSFAESGKRLGISEGAARVAAHRMKGRYRELLRASIAETVADASEIDDEIRHLVRVLSR